MKKIYNLSMLMLFVMMAMLSQRMDAQSIVLSENFSAITDSTSSTITNSLDQYTQLPGWSGNWVYPSNGKVKLGKSAEGGYIQTPVLNLSAENGQFMVTFDAKAWPNDATSIIVEVNNVPYTVEGLSTTSFNTFSLPFSCGTATTVIKFQSFQSSHSRFFIDNIVVTSQEIIDTIAPSLIEVTASENSLQVTFSEILNPSTAENINNYTLDHNTMVTSATMAGSNTVTISVSPSLVDGITYTLQVNNITDTAGNIMQPSTISFTYSNTIWDGTYAPWTNGTGTESDPFLIENAQQLAYLAYRVNNGLDAGGGHVSNQNFHYKLMTDVNLNGSESFQWTPIGYWISETNYYSFGGQFDGNNHTISGMHVNSSANRVGFFGYTDGATIKNLSIAGDTMATTGTYAGGVVGNAVNTTIISCENNCNISSSYNNYSYAGGIAGYLYGNTNITNCFNTSNVKTINSNSYSGGIAGQHNNGNVIILNCYNTGVVSASAPTSSYESYSGGIIGNTLDSSFITNCYNVGNISSSYSLYATFSGGIVGRDMGYFEISNRRKRSV